MWRSWPHWGKVFGALWPIIAAGIIALISWELVGEPSAERNERQAIALTQQAEARTSINAFNVARPREALALQSAIDAFRSGRRFVIERKYAEATERFAEVFTIVEQACPDCPNVLIRP